jgi:hypothetical protein
VKPVPAPDPTPLLLRPPFRAQAGATADKPLRVERIDPPHGAAGVFRDANVLVCLSHPAEPASVCPETLTVCDSLGTVPGRLLLSPDRQLVIWRPERLLRAGDAHLVVVSGVRDTGGRELAAHASSFVPCDLASADLSG